MPSKKNQKKALKQRQRESDDHAGESSAEFMPAHFFGNAKSVRYSTAVKANVEKQNFSTLPRHWYADAVVACLDCRRDFGFSAKEQRAWYEEYRFYVDSFPNRCPACRAKRREDKATGG